MYYKRTAFIKGKSRILTVPSDRVRQVHEILISHLNSIPLHESVHGFVFGRSILTNAAAHKGAALVLNLDVKNFFGSITLEKFYQTSNQVLIDYIPHYLIDWVYATCFWDGVLPQGSSCSPVLSNIFLKAFDVQLGEWCKENGIIYTRYADDLTFSFNFFSLKASEIRSYVQDLLSEYGLRLNHKKTLVRPAHQSQKVTGISINNESLRIPKKKREEFYLQVRNKEYQSLSASELGFLHFAKSVDERFYEKVWTTLIHQA
jgi:retron-type reverse transcriptase